MSPEHGAQSEAISMATTDASSVPEDPDNISSFYGPGVYYGWVLLFFSVILGEINRIRTIAHDVHDYEPILPGPGNLSDSFSPSTGARVSYGKRLRAALSRLKLDADFFAAIIYPAIAFADLLQRILSGQTKIDKDIEVQAGPTADAIAGVIFTFWGIQGLVSFYTAFLAMWLDRRPAHSGWHSKRDESNREQFYRTPGEMGMKKAARERSLVMAGKWKWYTLNALYWTSASTGTLFLFIPSWRIALFSRANLGARDPRISPFYEAMMDAIFFHTLGALMVCIFALIVQRGTIFRTLASWRKLRRLHQTLSSDGLSAIFVVFLNLMSSGLVLLNALLWNIYVPDIPSKSGEAKKNLYFLRAPSTPFHCSELDQAVALLTGAVTLLIRLAELFSTPRSERHIV